MKPYPVILLLLATSGFAQSDIGSAPAPRPRLTEEMRRASGETSSDSAKTPRNGQAADPDSVMMAPFGVNGTALPLYVQPKDVEPDDHPFTWADGGTILRNKGPVFTTEVKFQYNPFKYDPPDRKVDLLKISW